LRKTKAETEQTKEAITRAAEDLFSEHGYENVSLEDIAAAAGVTRGAVHWHFKNKQGLLLEIRSRIEMPMEHLHNLMISDSCQDPLLALADTLRKSLREFQDNPKLRKLTKIVFKFEYSGERESAGGKSPEQRAREVLTEVLRSAQERSSFSVPWSPESGALAFVGMLSGLLAEWVRDDTEFELIPDAEDVLMSVLDIWGAQLTHPNEKSG
jgi:AcrR family transcriptional regulator